MRSKARQTPATSALLITNVAIFLAMLIFGSTAWHTTPSIQLAWGANYGPATQDHQWWRLATAMFLHFGVLHLVVNMWALRDVGRLVERLYGSTRFAFLYFGAGVFGNLLSLVVQGNHSVSAGASGAVFGLYGALMVCLWQIRRRIDGHEFRWLFAAAAFFSLLMLALGWFTAGIDNAAHGAGLAAGALWGLVLAPPSGGRPPSQRSSGYAALALATAAAVLVAALPDPAYRFAEEVRARAAIESFLRSERNAVSRWDTFMASPQSEGLTFEQMAGQVDIHLAQAYADSFEQLAAASPTTNIPSARSLQDLQTYALQRRESALALANGLRKRSSDQIQKGQTVLQPDPSGPPPTPRSP